MNKKVSIIIPIFNSQHTIRRCLDCILKSSYHFYELLLLDDGSEDDSFSICQEYTLKDDRIKVFHHENHGVSYTRNCGLDVAAGDYVMFVDSDDTIAPSWISSYVKGIEESNADFVIGGLTIIHKDKSKVFPKLPQKGLPIEEYWKLLCEGSYDVFGYVPNKIYRTRFIQNNQIQFNEKMVLQEDLDFFLSALQHAKTIDCISECGYFYQYFEQKNQVAFLDLIRNKLKIITHIEKRYHGNEFDTTILKREICGHVYHYLRESSLKNDFISNCKKLEQFDMKWDNKNLTLSGEKRFVCYLAEKKQYGLLRKFFEIRNAVKKITQKRI